MPKAKKSPKKPFRRAKKKANVSITKLFADKNLGVKLDIGCGANKLPGFIGVDIRKMPGVDLVVDLEKFPWNIPSESASIAVCSHVLEHINPAKVDARVVGLLDFMLAKGMMTKEEMAQYVGDYSFESTFVRFMDEVWRVLKPGGEFVIKVPYAGTTGFYQDPTHINNITEATLYYFDPFHASNLYKIYRPKPWQIKQCFWDTEAIMEILLIKRREDKSFSEHVDLSGKGLNG